MGVVLRHFYRESYGRFKERLMETVNKVLEVDSSRMRKDKNS